MSDFNSEWNKATVNDGDQDSSFDPPADDGDYVIELVKGSALTSKKGDDWVVLELADVASGHAWTLMLGFKSQGQANVTKTACSRLGIEVEEVASLQELDVQLSLLAGRYFEVTVKTNGEYRNTYINGPAVRPQQLPVSDVPVPEEELAAAGVDDGDDVPF